MVIMFVIVVTASHFSFEIMKTNLDFSEAISFFFVA